MEVWRAWDELLGRPVAVKLLASARTDLRRAFQEGVNRAAGLSHPALETVYDSDRTRDASGRLVSYVVTEFLDGETLAERLRQGPLTASETVDVCAQIAGALDAAHKAGVTHGDLNPRRVVLVGGDVKIIDTGIGGIARGLRDANANADGGGEAADVRALGAVISACLPAGASGEPAAIAARCLAATIVDGPFARDVARLLNRDDGPSNAAFTARKSLADAPARGTAPARPARPARDHRTRAMRPPPPPRRNAAGVRLAAIALVIAIPVTAAVAIFVSAPRSPVTVPPPSPADTAARDVTGAVGRLRPIVSRGYTSGEIRSDAAIDLNNLITNLENDLTSDRSRKANRRTVSRRIALLQDKIVARQRERALSRDVAAELNRVLATIQT
ncbi:protein kinase [Actinomadura sp. 9N215]|uniref:protein kinase domain-containing protein n=1 Tax=Actinomadura sp. 9N215 TaxID=3375150 RepID=UPI0037A74A72